MYLCWSRNNEIGTGQGQGGTQEPGQQDCCYNLCSRHSRSQILDKFPCVRRGVMLFSHVLGRRWMVDGSLWLRLNVMAKGDSVGE